MARRFGRTNPYRSRIRRCAQSGLRGYEREMVHKDGHWYLPHWVDKAVRGKGGRVIQAKGE